MTKKFPPDFALVQNTYDILKNLQSLSQKDLKIPLAALPTENSEPEKDDEDEIQELVQQRKNLIAPLNDITQSTIQEKPADEKIVSCQHQNNIIQQLESKILELDQQNLSLNKRILELKYSKH